MKNHPQRDNRVEGLQATASGTVGYHRSGGLHGVFPALMLRDIIRWSTGYPSMTTVYSYVDMLARSIHCETDEQIGILVRLKALNNCKNPLLDGGFLSPDTVTQYSSARFTFAYSFVLIRDILSRRDKRLTADSRRQAFTRSGCCSE